MLGFHCFLYGRGERIRTSDPLHPMQVRYQAALRPDEAAQYSGPQLSARLSRRRSNSMRNSSMLIGSPLGTEMG
jgi:hypothetical protein